MLRLAAYLLIFTTLVSCDYIGAQPSQGSGSGKTGYNHKVQSGESLFSIAQKAYGDGLQWAHIWEANPWIDPDHRIRAGEIVYVPPWDDSWGTPARSRLAGELPALPPANSDTSANPSGASLPGAAIFRNLARDVSEKTVFGLRVHTALLFVVLFFLGHSVAQSLVVWLAAQLTFVKDASIGKASKAVFQTDMLTLLSLFVVVAIGMFLFYAGSSGGGEGSAASQLFPAVESFLTTRTGKAVAVFAVLLIYVILSLRFLPQAFGIQRARGATLTTLSVLIPHLGALYFMGQRLGWIY